MTTEEKLAKCIEAQVKGGFNQHRVLANACHPKKQRATWFLDLGDNAFRWEDWDDQERIALLEILLDPQGLRAAYGEGVHNFKSGECQRCGLWIPKLIEDAGDPTEFMETCSEVAAWKILNTWLSSSGDATKTIDTAYDLLPKP